MDLQQRVEAHQRRTHVKAEIARRIAEAAQLQAHLAQCDTAKAIAEAELVKLERFLFGQNYGAALQMEDAA
jgi:hypothetical protein